MAHQTPPPSDFQCRLEKEVTNASASHHVNNPTPQAALEELVHYWHSKFSLSHNNWIIPSQKMIQRLRELIAPLPINIQQLLIRPFEKPIRYYMDTAQKIAIRDLVPPEYAGREKLLNQVIVVSKCANFTIDIYNDVRKLLELKSVALVPAAKRFFEDNLIHYSQHETFMTAMEELAMEFPEIATQVIGIGCRQFDMQVTSSDLERWKTSLATLGDEFVVEAVSLIEGTRWCYFREGDISRAKHLLWEIEERPKCPFSSYLPHLATMRRRERKAKAASELSIQSN
jgi:hypothetical protein